MTNYTYGWKLKEEGWKEVPAEGECALQKKEYVEGVLSAAVAKTRQWDNVSYKVMKLGDYEREFVVLSCDGGGSRWINVTGDSLGAIFEEVGQNLF